MRFFKYVAAVPPIAIPLLAACVFAASLYFSSFGSNGQVDKEPGPVVSALDSYSPFEDMVGKRELAFDTETHSVTKSGTDRSSTDSKSKGSNPNVVTEQKGTFTVDEATHSVTVRFGAEATKYKLVEMTDRGLCILLSGDEDIANLNKSWFGDLQPPEKSSEWPG